jgi:hypothetical protein
MLKVSTIPLAVSFILGCSSQSADPPGAAARGAPAPGVATPPPHVQTVFDPLTQQLDKARDVQKTVDQNSDNTRKAVDSQERGDNTP